MLPPAALLPAARPPLQLLTGGARDAPERQRTLRATIDWSYDLLEPAGAAAVRAARGLRRRVHARGGGERLRQTGLDVVDGLASLVDNEPRSAGGTDDEPRFAMLETIREYAAERLEESDEAEELRRRHAEHFLALAEEAEPNLSVGSHAEWLDRLERDHDNLRAALDWLEASGDERACPAAGGGAVAVLVPERPPGGRPASSRKRAPRRRAPDGGPRQGSQRSGLHGAQDRRPLRRRRLRADEALALHRTLGDAWGAAFSGFMLGTAAASKATGEGAAALRGERTSLP